MKYESIGNIAKRNRSDGAGVHMYIVIHGTAGARAWRDSRIRKPLSQINVIRTTHRHGTKFHIPYGHTRILLSWIFDT